LIARKGLDTLLRALAQLDSPHWQLHIAGRQDVDRKYSAEMRCLVGEMGLAERVVFLGGVSDRELESEMRLAHVLVVPSQYEGFGIVYLEGMGFGLPAIGTNAGGAGEIIQPGINGWLIDPGDAGALARVLERFLLDRQELQRMSLAAWRRFADFPTWDAGMAALRGSLAGLCGSAPVDLAE
jgi:glycosyltransferase involved in cell wall biosynthesis